MKLRNTKNQSASFLRDFETVLVVDDDEMVRSVVFTVLKQQGYNVFEAADGAQAVEILRGHGGGIDIIVSDIDMPRMNGIELLQWVVYRLPHIAVLLVTGAIQSVRRTKIIQDCGASLLRKPFRAEELLQSVESVLDSSESYVNTVSCGTCRN